MPPYDEAAFRRWYALRAQALGLDPNPDDPRHYYDYRAAWARGAEPAPSEDGSWHWPSEFKREGHPNRYVEGMDTISGQPSFEAILDNITKALLRARQAQPGQP